MEFVVEGVIDELATWVVVVLAKVEDARSLEALKDDWISPEDPLAFAEFMIDGRKKKPQPERQHDEKTRQSPAPSPKLLLKPKGW